MWSGRATTWARDPRRYVRALTADIGKTYPQLGQVSVDHAWSGTLGNSIHRMPQIGELGPACGSRAASVATVSTPRRWPATSSPAPSSTAIKPGGNSRRSNWSGRAEFWAAASRRPITGRSVFARPKPSAGPAPRTLAHRRTREAEAVAFAQIQSSNADDQTEPMLPPETETDAADETSPLTAIMNRRRQRRRPEEADV